MATERILNGKRGAKTVRVLTYAGARALAARLGFEFAPQVVAQDENGIDVGVFSKRRMDIIMPRITTAVDLANAIADLRGDALALGIDITPDWARDIMHEAGITRFENVDEETLSALAERVDELAEPHFFPGLGRKEKEPVTESDLVAAYRKTHPRSRIQSITPYLYNGSRRRGRWCVVCGEHGPTWCSDYPETLRAKGWAALHLASHLSEAAKGE